MSLPADPPKLPKWPFLAGDVALIGLAAFIAYRSPPSFGGMPLIAIVSCVVVGAVLATYPFVVEYTRASEIALDERQRALEALSVTVATSAEQISIAANGLHEITELAQRNLKSAELLPQKIQEKMAAVIATFDDARSDEREELEREVATLRAAESDKLTAAADRVARAVNELSKLESSAQRHLSASADAISRASDTLSPLHAKIAESVERAERALDSATRSSSTRQHGYAVGLSADSSISAEPLPQSGRPPDAPPSNAAPLEHPGVSYTSTGTTSAPSPAHPENAAHAQPTYTSHGNAASNPQTTDDLISADPFTAAIMSVLEPSPSGALHRTANGNGSSDHGSEATRGFRPNAEVLAPPEPAPIPVQRITEIVPVAPRDSASASPILLPADSTTLYKGERKRAPRKPKSATPPSDVPPASPDLSASGSVQAQAAAFADHPVAAETPASPTDSAPSTENVASADFSDVRQDRHEETPPAMDSPEPAAALAAEQPEPAAITSDGATRLLVTAYIGIGNRLFIRGSGGGLSWEKGIPLQFVSIGKWRWESHDASTPVAFKLYKNDSVECPELGEQTLEAGRQLEVTAKF